MTAVLKARAVAIPGRFEASELLVRAGQMVALIGPNGSGKTSLLRALARIEGRDGKVWIDGEDLDGSAPARRGALLGFVAASRELVWPISARDVIGLGLASPDAGEVDRLIAELELGFLAGRPVTQLSTGERARVLLARALVAKPKVLLLDEPLSNLDPYWVMRVLEILQTRARGGAGVLVALHDLAQLAAFDRALLVHHGRIVGDAAPNDILSSRDFVEAFRVEPVGSGWKIRMPEDRRSSP